VTDFTSERLIPDYYQSSRTELALYLLHIKAYEYVAALADGKNVLDLGCGLGYGTAIISKSALKVIGADIDKDAVASAASLNRGSNMSFTHIEPTDKVLSSFKDSVFDIVISFQVIEHVEDVASYLSSINRVLKKDGILFIATPNRNARNLSIQHPWNHHHLREYSKEELKKLMENYFVNVKCSGLTATGISLKNEKERVRRISLLMIPFSNKLLSDKMRRSLLRRIWQLSIGRKRAAKSSFAEDEIRQINKELVLTDNKGIEWLNLFIKAEKKE